MKRWRPVPDGRKAFHGTLMALILFLIYGDMRFLTDHLPWILPPGAVIEPLARGRSGPVSYGSRYT